MNENPLMRSFTCRWLVGILIAGASIGAAHARQGALPYSLAHRAVQAVDVPVFTVPGVSATAMRAQVDAREHAIGPQAKRLLVATGEAVSITPRNDGAWQMLADGSGLWRIRIRAPGATDLRFSFAPYALPPSARLY